MSDEMLDEHEDALAAALLQRLPGPAAGAEIRVRSHLRRSMHVTWGTRALRLLRVGVWASLAVAPATAAALLYLQGVAPVPSAPALVSESQLASNGASATDTSMNGVTLRYDGNGRIEKGPEGPRIRWDVGTLHVEVEADRGIQLAVQTRDASVRVVGTGFSVERDALGTRVSVRHGLVEVACSDEPVLLLRAGDARSCLPTSAAALLGRARALELRGAPAVVVLESLDRGLVAGDGQAAVKQELAASRVRVLVELGHDGEALDAARAYLADGQAVRREEVRELALLAASREGGCPSWLAELAPERCPF